MALIASGYRQVHYDSEGKSYVLFDDGVYPLDGDVKIESDAGEEWVWCESHADDDKDVAHAKIGGVMMPLAGPSADGRDFGEVEASDE